MLLYRLEMSPPAIVTFEASAVGMTPEAFIRSKRLITRAGKRRIAYHLYMERDMSLQDAAHWLDCDFSTIYVRVQAYRREILGHSLLRRPRQDASLSSQLEHASNPENF